MREDFYRQKCLYPARYDKVIDLIKEKNPAATNFGRDPEEWASNVLNSCISKALFGDRVCFYSNGMALAVLIPGNNPQVEVAFCP